MKSAVEQQSIRALCTYEVVEGIIDSLNEVCRTKVMTELSRAEAAQSGCSVDISTACSSHPMTKMATTLGYESGLVLDLTTEECERQEIRFFRLEDSERSQVKLRERAPCLLALPLPSTVFATMQPLNFTRQSDNFMERKKVMTQINFAVNLCSMPSKSGRKFMIEQPAGASAWTIQLMNKWLFVKGVVKVNFDFLYV